MWCDTCIMKCSWAGDVTSLLSLVSPRETVSDTAKQSLLALLGGNLEWAAAYRSCQSTGRRNTNPIIAGTLYFQGANLFYIVEVTLVLSHYVHVKGHEPWNSSWPWKFCALKIKCYTVVWLTLYKISHLLFCRSGSTQGGLAVAISIATHPMLHTSHFRPYGVARRTSGAMNAGVPATS